MRTRILELLRQRSGGYVSGEEISQQLGVSRTAVWKHIQEIKQAGYAIEAHSRRGYTLRQAPDLLLPDEIHTILDTKVLGRDIHYYPEVESTNNVAKKLAADGCREGTLIVAERQSSGRGRISRGWYSPYGKGIWMSVVLKPPFSPQEAPKCTLMAAVAINKAIREFTGVQSGIKWPNDILYNGKKLVGILTEMSAEMDAINYIVIGMGINVNINAAEFPDEIADIASSLSEATGRKVERLPLLAAILKQLEKLYTDVTAHGFEQMFDEWRAQSVTLGQAVAVVAANNKFEGVAVNIDEDGALLVKAADGLKRVIAGDVSIRPKVSGDKRIGGELCF